MALHKVGVWSILAATLCGAAATSPAADWTMFRGPARDGVAAADAAPPLEWSDQKNVKWKVALPRPGNSSPIVVGQKLYLATALDADGKERSLLCFDRENGHELWRKTVQYDMKEPTHATNPYCAASPAADADVVVVWHGSAGLHCYDHAGNLLWKRDLGIVRHIWGWAGSPIIHSGAVYLNAGPGARQFVCAIDKKTGALLWQTDEPGGGQAKFHGSWTTPRMVEIQGQWRLLVFMPNKVNAYDPKSGKVVWSVDGGGTAGLQRSVRVDAAKGRQPTWHGDGGLRRGGDRLHVDRPERRRRRQPAASLGEQGETPPAHWHGRHPRRPRDRPQRAIHRLLRLGHGQRAVARIDQRRTVLGQASCRRAIGFISPARKERPTFSPPTRPRSNCWPPIRWAKPATAHRRSSASRSISVPPTTCGASNESGGLIIQSGWFASPAASERPFLIRPFSPSLPHFVPKPALDVFELAKRRVQAVHEHLRLFRRRAGLDRVAQGGGGVVQIAGAFGELPGPRRTC